MSLLCITLVNWVCVDVGSSVGASPNSESLVDEVTQML